MRIVLASQGTLGDHLPLAGFGNELMKKGFEVYFACNRAMHDLVWRAGLKPLDFGRSLGPNEAAERAEGWDHWLASPIHKTWTDEASRILMSEYEELMSHLNEGDLIIGTRNLLGLQLIAQARNCRWGEIGLNCGAMVDLDKHDVAKESCHPWKTAIKRVQQDMRHRFIGSSSRSHGNLEPLLRLHSIPDFMAPSGLPCFSSVRTGFWCWDDPKWSTWEPPEELRRVLESDSPPIGLVFSSQPVVSPSTLLKKHIEIAQRLERKLILVAGWAFSDNLAVTDESLDELLQSQSIVAIAEMPLSYLMPRLSTVFIHGGMGMLAQAMRGRCQIIIEPFGNDQFQNARVAQQQGLAIAVHPHRINVDELVEVIKQRALHPSPKLPPSTFNGIHSAASYTCDCIAKARAA